MDFILKFYYGLAFWPENWPKFIFHEFNVKMAVLAHFDSSFDGLMVVWEYWEEYGPIGRTGARMINIQVA